MSAGERHLRMLLAIAEQGTLTRAAEQLHLTQPALTRALQQLERHLGARLVDRSTRHLRLTPVGERYVERSRRAVAELDAVLDPGRVDHGPLRVGYAWSALGGLTATGLGRWDRERPGTRLELHRIDERDAGLGSGAVDAAIVRDLPEAPGTERVLVMDEPRVAALSAGHRLAAADGVRLVDLADEPVVVNTVSGTTGPMLWPADRRPSRLVEVGNTDEWLLAITANAGVGVTGAGTAHLHSGPGAVFVPVLDAPTIAVEVAWRVPAHPAVADFVALVTDAASSAG
jgi:DNA-binding transcriptional LysR family regulator